MLVALALGAAPLAAQAEGAEPASDAPGPVAHVHAHGPSGDPGDGSTHRHHVMVMAAPGVADAGGSFVSAGIGYEYRLPVLGDVIGVGAMAEYMFMSGHGHQMLMASASIHPIGGLVLLGAVGASHRHDHAGAAATGSGGMRTDAVVRLSAGWDVHAGSLMVTPYVALDGGGRSARAVSAGLCVGRMF